MIVKLNIDGIDYEINDGDTILDVSRKLGVPIPSLCYLKDFTSFGGCGLCAVEIDSGTVVLSCMTKVRDGMSIKTDSQKLSQIRKINLDTILKNHRINCLNCSANGVCELQKFATEIYKKSDYIVNLKSDKSLSSGKNTLGDLVFKPEKCVDCMRCVKFVNKCCDKNIEKISLLGTIDPSSDISLNVEDVCPTEALRFSKGKRIPEFLLKGMETYDVNDIFAPKFQVFKLGEHVIRSKILNGSYISNKTRRLLTNIPIRRVNEDSYNSILKRLVDKMKTPGHEKCVFIVGENLDLVSFYYLKKISEKCEKVLIVMDDCEISGFNIEIGLNKFEMVSMDYAIYLGAISDINRYHIATYSSRLKTQYGIHFGEIDSCLRTSEIGYSDYPFLFIDIRLFGEYGLETVMAKIQGLKNKVRKEHKKSLKCRVIPTNLSQLLMKDIPNLVPLKGFFEKFNKHDLDFICAIGECEYDVGCDEVMTVAHSCFKPAGDVEYIPSRHFLEDETYHLDIFRRVFRTTKVVDSDLKSHREFLFDLLKGICGDKFEDINVQLHDLMRKRFFSK